MEFADHEAEWACSDFEVRDEPGIEVEEADKGVKGGAMIWEGPVPD